MSEINNGTINKIAIVKLSALGDIIHAIVALQFIKKVLPNVQIDWIVEKAFYSILEHNPHINAIHTVNLKSLKKNKFGIMEEVRKLRKLSLNNYDLIIDAQGLIKSSIVSKLLGTNVVGFDSASIREKFASFFYKNTISIPYTANTIDRNVKVMTSIFGLGVSKDDVLNKDSFLFYKNEDKIIYDFIDKKRKNIAFVIGASKSNKIYSKEKLVNIIKSLNENTLIVWGNEEEHQVALFIASKTEAKVLPKMDLNTLKALIANVDLVIGNDTGPTHMAWALNVPSITLFGNTPGYRNTYETNINVVLESNTKVNPLKLDKQDFSISEIKEEKIISLAKSLLHG